MDDIRQMEAETQKELEEVNAYTHIQHTYKYSVETCAQVKHLF